MRTRTLRELLDDLIAEVEVDVTEGAEDRSERTQRVYDAILDRYEPGDE